MFTEEAIKEMLNVYNDSLHKFTIHTSSGIYPLGKCLNYENIAWTEPEYLVLKLIPSVFSDEAVKHVYVPYEHIFSVVVEEEK